MASKSQLKKIFNEAIEMESHSDRNEYLDRVCEDDERLRAEVEGLLDAFEDAGTFMQTPENDSRPGTAETRVLESSSFDPSDSVIIADEAPGTTIGPFTLVKRLGQGGMGTVYLAEQTTPVRRQVALKIVKAGMNSRDVIARFEAERQALALMDHPNIARVLDAGATESGQPYFAMELVDGIPITKFCDEYRLDIEGRLRLFTSVCRAIQHAHQKGIVHRDIKPSNVLAVMIDDQPMIKVIDFGIAKAVQQKLTDQTYSTEIGQVIGTLEYMSPEQAAANPIDIDTRSDIYALGILLYELLTGTTPISRQQMIDAGLLEILRLIRESEPPRPSTRLTEAGLSSEGASLASVSAVRMSAPDRLPKIIRGDLDWIVMKSLEKERDRRYQTASGLAADIERFVNNEVVEACPPSAGYRFRKFASRNRALITSIALVSVILCFATIVSSAMAVIASNERKVAEEARGQAEVDKQLAIASAEAAKKAQKAEEKQRIIAEEESRRASAVAQFLVDVFRKADPQLDGRNVKLADALADSAHQLKTQFEDQPKIKASLLQAIGQSFVSLGLFAEGEELAQKSYDILEREIGADHQETLSSQMYLGVALANSGQHQRAVEVLENVYQRRKQVLGERHLATLRTMDHLGDALAKTKDSKRAHQFKQEAYTAKRETLGEHHIETIISKSNLAIGLLDDDDQLERAIEMLEETQTAQAEQIGESHPNTMGTMNNLAIAYERNHQWAKSIELLNKVIELKEERLGPNHPGTNISRNNLATLYLRKGEYETARRILETTYESQKQSIGIEHPVTLTTSSNIATALRDSGNPAAAIALLEPNLKVCREQLGDSHPTTQNMISGLARAYWKDRQYNSSIPLFEEFLTARRQQNQLYDFESLNTMRVLGECYLKTNQDQKANDLYSDFLEYSLYAERQQMEIATDATHIGKNLLDRKQYGLASQFFSAALHTCLEHAERKLRIYELQTLLALSQMGQAIVTPEASADPEDLLKTAKVLLLDTYEGLEELKPTAKSRILKHRAAGALVHIYVRTKETQQALKWKKIYESLAP